MLDAGFDSWRCLGHSVRGQRLLTNQSKAYLVQKTSTKEVMIFVTVVSLYAYMDRLTQDITDGFRRNFMDGQLLWKNQRINDLEHFKKFFFRRERSGHNPFPGKS